MNKSQNENTEQKTQEINNEVNMTEKANY